MKPKDAQIVTRLSEDEKNELEAFATSLDVPTSQIVRDAVREKIAKLKAAKQKAEAAVTA